MVPNPDPYLKQYWNITTKKDTLKVLWNGLTQLKDVVKQMTIH